MAFPSLKQFAAWVTGLTDSYRHNPFVRATASVIVLQVLLTLLTIAMFWWAVGYSQEATVTSISQHIEGAAQGVPSEPGDLPRSINNVRQQTLTYAFIGMVMLAAVFGILLARFALWPARNSLQFQKRFIGNVAHEIRTPMAIIKTNTEVALMDPKLSKDVREVFEETVRELDRMSETINNLLTFDSLIRPGSMKHAPVDMAAILRTVAGRHEELAYSRGVSVTQRIKDGVYVYGNATALEQVVTNLLKNAINYTPRDQDKSVELALGIDMNDRVVVTVADSGVGIAQKDLYHIFEPFYRADMSRARGVGTGSSGLGLAIVNEIVRLHKGSISIRSAPNEGTTIKVYLPQSKTEPQDTVNGEPNGASEVSVDFS